MSGSESLTPYIRDVNDAEYPTIVVDSREASSAPKIIKGLREHGAEIKIQVLDKGDYIVSEQCAFERKTVNDFVYTLTRRYLFEQVFLLKEAYVKPFILIEGYMEKPLSTLNLKQKMKTTIFYFSFLKFQNS